MHPQPDPLALYSSTGQMRHVPAIDAPAWLKNGWTTHPQKGAQSRRTENLPAELASSEGARSRREEDLPGEPAKATRTSDTPPQPEQTVPTGVAPKASLDTPLDSEAPESAPPTDKPTPAKRPTKQS